MEANNLKALECTLDMIKADTQLLYASDWPHFDFDLPSEITDLPFLSEADRSETSSDLTPRASSTLTRRR